MKIACINNTSNKGNTFVAQDILTDSLPHQANTNNIHQYLTPDYFLPASYSKSYYSKKYSGNHATSTRIVKKPICHSKSSKIARVASVMLLSLSFLATAVKVDASPNTELSTLGQSTITSNSSFLFGNGSEGTSTNVPLPPIMPQSSPPVPPTAPAMPDLASDASIGGKSDNRSAFLESIRNFGKGVLRKVKREPKPKVVSSDGDLMSQLHNTLERRRSGISGEKKSAKPKKVVKQAPKLTAEEQARKKAENLARAATIREQNKKKWEEATKKNEEIASDAARKCLFNAKDAKDCDIVSEIIAKREKTFDGTYRLQTGGQQKKSSK